jgi:hypothetical protein
MGDAHQKTQRSQDDQQGRSVQDDATRRQRLRSEAQQSCEPRMTLAHAALGPAFLKHIVQILALK